MNRHPWRAVSVALCLVIVAAGRAHAAAPLNDDFTDAALLTGLTGQVSGTTQEATTEDGSATPDVWFRWVAPESRRLILRLDAPAGFGDVEIGDGSSLGGFFDQSTDVICELYGPPVDACVELAVQQGTTYHIRVIAAAGLPGQGAFDLDWRAAPLNDDQANATMIAGLSGSEPGTTTDATDDVTGTLPRDVWYAWTAPTTLEMLFTVHAPDAVSLLLDVDHAGSPPTASAGLAVDCTDHGFDALDRACFRFSAEAGTQYIVRIVADRDGSPGWSVGGPFTLMWQPVAQIPANDLFANAHVLSGLTGTVSADTTSAGEEPPSIPVGVRDLWYVWQAPADARMLFAQTAPQADTVAFQIGTGATPGTFTHEGDPATCAIYEIDGLTSTCFKLDATAGTVYHVRVGGADVVGNGFSVGMPVILHWRPLPVNDEFANAQPITGATGSVAGTTVDASEEPGMPPGRDVWYTYVAATSEPILFDLQTPPGAFPGFAIGHPPEIFGWASEASTVDCATAGLDPVDRWCMLLNPTAGTEYHVRVQIHLPEPGFYPPGGPFVLSWRVASGPFASLCDLVTEYADNAGISKSLCAKLAVAESKDGQAHANLIDAFVNEVEAQSGKAFSPSEAATLIAAAHQL